MHVSIPWAPLLRVLVATACICVDTPASVPARVFAQDDVPESDPLNMGSSVPRISYSSLALNRAEATEAERKIGFRRMAFTSGGAFLTAKAGASFPERLVVWDAVTGRRHFEIQDGSIPIIGAASISPDGKQLAIGLNKALFLRPAGLSTAISVWDMTRKRRVATFRGNWGGVNSIVFAPDSQHIIAAAGLPDRSGRHPDECWIVYGSIPSGKATPARSRSPIMQLTTTPDRKRLFSLDQHTRHFKDAQLVEHSVKGPKKRASMKVESSIMAKATVSAHGRCAAFYDGHAQIGVLDWDRQESIAKIEHRCIGLQFAKDPEVIVSISKNRVIWWRARTGTAFMQMPLSLGTEEVALARGSTRVAFRRRGKGITILALPSFIDRADNN